LTIQQLRLVITSLLLGAFLLLAGCTEAPPPAINSGTAGNPALEANGTGVVLLRYKPGSESTEQRERGFLETLEKEYPDIAVISDDQFSGLSSEESKKTADQLLIRFGDRITGMFAVCEPNADGTLKALVEAEKIDDVVFVAFDPNAPLVEALGQGKVAGIVLQDPVTMGYLGVKTMVAHLAGEKVDRRISTGEFVATPENMQSEEMQRLLHPPQFSGSPFQPAETKYRIAVIPKGTTHEFWQSVRFGAEKAAKELGDVEIVWNGPSSEGNVDEQIGIVQSMFSKGVHGIVLAPNDSQSLVSVVREANEKSIPTVIFDSGLDPSFTDFVSYVATDNYNGGAMAARCMAAALQKQQASRAD
jgi:ABC-type sugar transport system substrate-binding protein